MSKNPTIDWSKAPEGTTGAMVANFDSRGAGGKTFVGKVEFLHPRGCERCHYTEGPENWTYYEAPAVWNGEGLPPVGIVCCAERGECVRIIAHVDQGGGHTLAVGQVGERGTLLLATAESGSFRPFRTPRQIAFEARDNAVKDMLAVWNAGFEGHVKDGLYALYDANYRKQAAP